MTEWNALGATAKYYASYRQETTDASSAHALFLLYNICLESSRYVPRKPNSASIHSRVQIDNNIDGGHQDLRCDKHDHNPF